MPKVVSAFLSDLFDFQYQVSSFCQVFIIASETLSGVVPISKSVFFMDKPRLNALHAGGRSNNNNMLICF